jgi:hypothetical protein
MIADRINNHILIEIFLITIINAVISISGTADSTSKANILKVIEDFDFENVTIEYVIRIWKRP